MANQRDVAKEAGVSSASVSRFINNQELVSKNAAFRIKKAINKLNYRVDHSAMSLKTGKFSRVGIIAASIGPFYYQILSVIEKILGEAGYFTNIYFTRKENTGENYHNFNYSLINNKQVDGFIIFPLMTEEDDNIVTRMTEMNEKFVVIDREFSDAKINQVVIDNYKCGKNAAEVLIESGCTKPLFIWGLKDMWSSRMRFEGFKDALKNAAINFNETREIKGEFNAEYTYNEVMPNFGSIPEFDGVFASNDFSAIAFIKAAAENNLTAGRDFKIIGFDNCEASAFLHKPLTTFSQPLTEVGELAARMLLDLIAEREIKQNKIILGGNLIRRESA